MEKNPHNPNIGIPNYTFVTAIKMKSDSYLPAKENLTDSSYPLTLTERCDNRCEDEIGEINMFTTGLKLKIPRGYYVMVTSRPELLQNGYFLPGPLIFESKDDDEEEELIVPLYKFRETGDLDIPFIGCNATICESNNIKISQGNVAVQSAIDARMVASRAKQTAATRRRGPIF